MTDGDFIAVAGNWSKSEIVTLTAGGSVEALNTKTGARSFLNLPKIRHLQGNLNEVWIYGQDGAIYIYGKNYPTPRNLASIGP